jgi:mono/diheme cytochrome c family protein
MRMRESAQSHRFWPGIRGFEPGTGIARCPAYYNGDAVLSRKGLAAMKTFKTMMVATVVMVLVAGFALISATARVNNAQDFDAAATYKAKCQACHGPAAEKKFDAALPDAELVQVILKGKKGEKPPFMPAFGEKGISEEQAKALVAHMKSLKQ